MKIHESSPGLLAFRCPGCRHAHLVKVKNPAIWTWNGSYDKPTFSPSILVKGGKDAVCDLSVCHSFVKDGKIRFLSDCTHELKGQTVELPEWSTDQ